MLDLYYYYKFSAGNRVLADRNMGVADKRVSGNTRRIITDSPTIAPDIASNFQHADLRIIDARNKIDTPGLLGFNNMNLIAFSHLGAGTIDRGYNPCGK